MSLLELPEGLGLTAAAEELRVGPFAADHAGAWVVLHVKSRQEKSLSRDLAALCVPHFLPLLVQRRPNRGRTAAVETPLFPGYVFLRGALEDAYRADRTKRVANIIPVVDQQRLHDELWNLHMALSRGVGLDPHHWIQRGIRVEVVAGPLMGVRGLVEDRLSMDRVILQVQMLGSAVSVEVDSDCVAAID